MAEWLPRLGEKVASLDTKLSIKYFVRGQQKCEKIPESEFESKSQETAGRKILCCETEEREVHYYLKLISC